MVTAKIEEGSEELVQRLAGSWEQLCEENGAAPFQRPEWITAYLQAFEPSSEVAVLTAASGDRLVALLPLVRKNCWFAGVPVRKLAGAANIHSVQFDVLRSPSSAGVTGMKEIWNVLKGTPGWDIVELPLIREDSAARELLSLASKDGFSTMSMPFQESPILRMQVDGNGQSTSVVKTSRHFRHELRRFARLLKQETGDDPKLVRRTNPDAKTLKQFYELEAAGWKGQQGSAIQCAPETQAFYDQIAREATARGYFCLYTLESNNEMVAGAFSVVTKDCLYPLKTAYNEKLRRGAPGQLLFNEMLADCAHSGIRALFFGGKKDRYKTSWTSESIAHFTGYIFAPGLRSQLAYISKAWLLSRLGRLRRGLRAGSRKVGE